MAVIENDVIKVTVSNSSSKNVIRVSPGVAALSSVSISLNELNNVDTSGISNGQTIVYNNGSFVAGDSGAVESINGEFPDAEGDVAIDFSVDGLSDVTAPSPSEGDILKYESNRWVNDSLGKADVGLNNVDNTSDSDKPVSTATQTALDAKANTSAVPVSLNDLSDVSIIGTPAKNTALLYDETANAFKFQPSFTNRFEDEAENNKQAILPFVERVYTVKTDGDGIFIDSQSDTPTAGKVIKRKIYHKVGFIASGDLIGDYTLVHTFADDIAYSATESVFEGFRDGDTYGTAPFTLIQTWEEVSATAYLLDETFGSGAEAAYSTRQLRNAATDCMVIRRASDSTTTTIGFDGSGNISEAAIETFCTGTTCTVYQWLDQSGNGNTATAPSTGEEPTIYTGGALVKLNGKTALLGTSVTGFTLNSLIDYVQPNDTPSFFFHGMTTSATSYYTDSTSTRLYLLKNAPTYIAAQTFAITRNGTSSSVAVVNERELLSFISSQSRGFDVNRIFIKGNVNVQGYTGYYNEAIFYKTNKSSVRTDIEENIGDYFTQNTPLLDTYTGAAAAYSLRKLSSSYSGSAVEVYNGSSYADIGFDVFGGLNTVALAAHCGSNSGYVSKWYSQTGSNDAVQTNTANMPKIYDGTTGVVTENGKPALQFDSTDGFATTDTVNVTPLFFAAVAQGVGRRQMFAIDSFNTFEANIWASSGSQLYNLFVGGVDFNGTKLNDASQHLFTGSYVTGAIAGHVDSVSDISGSSAYTGSGSITIGQRNANQMNCQEIVIWQSNAANRTGIETNINTFYNIYS